MTLFGRKNRPAPASGDKAATPQRILFRDEDIRCEAVVAHGTLISQAELVATGGLMVLGQLLTNKLLATADKSVVVIAASGVVDGGAIDASDLLIEGKATGVTITAEGRIEIGPAAVVEGSLLKGPDAEVYIAPTADVTGMTMRSMQARAAQATTLRNGTDG